MAERPTPNPAAVNDPLARRFRIVRVEEDHHEQLWDSVAVEEPLEIRIRYWFKQVQRSESLAVTMRTPGHDRELAAGFLLSEGIIHRPDEIADFYHLGGSDSNEIQIELSSEVDVESWRTARNSFVNASCGICGKRSREAIAQLLPKLPESGLQLDAAWIACLQDQLRTNQKGFSKTGGLHAAALFTAGGMLKVVFEDIGRHNALDKLIGHCLLHGPFPLHNHVIFMSSRSSFELVQKVVAARAPVLATVGSSSSLAIETARDYGLTLLGFVRGDRFNIYSGHWRIHLK